MLTKANLRTIFKHLPANSTGFCTLRTDQLNIGYVYWCLFFDDLALLVHFTRLSMTLYHIDPLNDNLVLLSEYTKDFSYSTFILAGNYFNLIIFLQVCSTLSHFFTFYQSMYPTRRSQVDPIIKNP